MYQETCFEVISVLMKQYLIFIAMPIFCPLYLTVALGTIYSKGCYYSNEPDYIRMKDWKDRVQ